MPVISSKNEEKISEQVINFLYSIFPKQIFTSDIAKELARDEEYIKKILIRLEKKSLVTKITKNPKGLKYIRRIRWRISNKAYDTFRKYQNKP